MGTQMIVAADAGASQDNGVWRQKVEISYARVMGDIDGPIYIVAVA